MFLPCRALLTSSQLAGLHSNAYISDLFAKAFATDGMKAYVQLIQQREADIGCDVLTHQKWSGADYADNLLKTVTGGVSSTAAMGKGCVFPFSAPSLTRAVSPSPSSPRSTRDPISRWILIVNLLLHTSARAARFPPRSMFPTRLQNLMPPFVPVACHARAAAPSRA